MILPDLAGGVAMLFNTGCPATGLSTYSKAFFKQWGHFWKYLIWLLW